MDRYARCIAVWDDIFSKQAAIFPKAKETGVAALDEGLRWLTCGSSSVLDFGCGNGTLLCFCSLYGTKTHVGVDLSPKAIESAAVRSKLAPSGEFTFLCGGTELLKTLPAASMDGAILSNILDNLYPADARFALSELARILRPGGKLLVKLNAFLTDEQASQWNLRRIEGNLFDDGLLLWNNTDAEWEALFAPRFSVVRRAEVLFEGQEQPNRLFGLVNQPSGQSRAAD